VRVLVKVYDAKETLLAGQRVGESLELIYQGPADYSGPSKDWQNVVALEGRFSGALYVKTVKDLNSADRVEITGGRAGAQGTYTVESATTNGWQWTLVLRRIT